MANNVYAPGSGFAQTLYFQQQATALNGGLYSASDISLIDAYVVKGLPTVDFSNGLEAGLGVVRTAFSDGARPGINNFGVSIPVAATTAAGFYGISVRNQQMQSNSAGEACWFEERMCNVMSAHRVGGRVWAQLSIGTSAVGGTVHMIVANTTSHDKPIGSFVTAEIAVDTVELTNATFQSVTVAPASGTIPVLIELGVA